VDVRKDADVRGDIMTPNFILHEGARFNGRADPAQLNAAVTVARFQQRQRDEQKPDRFQAGVNDVEARMTLLPLERYAEGRGDDVIVTAVESPAIG
jgi:hypothetical protein